jgi:hypothetical protein
MSAKIEKIMDNCMSTQESLSLPHRLEPPHTPLSYPRLFVRLLSTIILVLLSTVDRLRNQRPIRNTITP